MKMKVEWLGKYWMWKVFGNNGCFCCQSGSYTRRDNAVRGLKNFCRKLGSEIEKLI